VAKNPSSTEETARLNELWFYDIVDTEPDPRFDEIVRLAAAICRVEIAAISLVESQRLWFKAKLGLSSDEMQVEGSFCKEVVAGGAPIIVGDAAAEPLFRDSSLVASGIRAYLGYPLTSPSGAVLGSLCVLDVKPRDWTPVECEAVRVLALQVVARFDLRRANAELMQLWEERRDIETRSLAGRRADERRIASELHEGLGQDLCGLTLMLKAVRDSSQESATCTELEKIEKIMRGTIDYCRRLARENTAFGFIHGSLRESLERFLDGVNELSHLRCELHWRNTVALRDRAVAYNIYRIAQEAVTNAVRHSGGQRIHVHLAMHNERLIMEIDDDGRGIDTQLGGSTGVGIETMRFRARTYGGGVDLLQRLPRGTRVRCEIPLPLSHVNG